MNTAAFSQCIGNFWSQNTFTIIHSLGLQDGFTLYIVDAYLRMEANLYIYKEERPYNLRFLENVRLHFLFTCLKTRGRFQHPTRYVMKNIDSLTLNIVIKRTLNTVILRKGRGSLTINSTSWGKANCGLACHTINPITQ